MSERRVFLCDINKNLSCRKTGCVINGGECYCTRDPEVALLDKNGKPVPCPPGRRIDITITDEQDRRQAMNLVHAVRVAQEENPFQDKTVRMTYSVADELVRLLGKYVLGVNEK